ncbi:FAD-dependent oxidoreductase [Magnetospirillum sp. 64-120]|uniref:hydroxysqualene dehydroxylase n=1 Tax=Magnetospirillum sp. 64-120 TaxID=1895778 RepID=UPI00092C392D|nr:FAD-dependent oxidoreductase [Magnetospirillum sp. 64-120]OJX80983.1 MAG: hypothetical protein BGO92_07815 [Magnetospirillum sp. 64-120]
MKPRLHVVGAGLSGLAAALAVSHAGYRVVIHEAAPQAGGRCRSFFDPLLGRTIDNGSHLVLGVNKSVLGLARAVGAPLSPLPPVVDFLELTHGQRWQARAGKLPVQWREVLAALFPRPRSTVTQVLGHRPGFQRFWQPLCLALLNTAPHLASAALFARVLRTILLGGPNGMRGHLFTKGLSADLIDPILARLHRNGAEIRYQQRLTAISQHKLTFGQAIEIISDHDKVVLALPPWAVENLLGTQYRFQYETIANLHYLLPLPVRRAAPLGLIGGQAQWLFVRDDVASVTISAAPDRVDPARIWAEIAPILACPPSLPPHRVILEKRATLRHDIAAHSHRPGPTTEIPGVFLAGDWLASPWPCTLESAASSGLAAARLALGRDDLRFS